jgi:hypothetical protein
VVPTPKVEQAVKVEHVTNIRFDPSHGVTPVVRVESALRPRRQEDVTNNAARQSRWRSKQDAAALRLQARERMKVLRARRKNEESGDLRLPQHLLGHVSIHTTAACAHVTPRRERGAVDRIPGGAGRATKTSSLERGAGVRARIALCIATNDPRLAS